MCIPEFPLSTSGPTEKIHLTATERSFQSSLQCKVLPGAYRHTQKHPLDPIPVATWLGNRPRFKLAEVEGWLRSEGQPGGKWKSENLGYKDEITKRQTQRRFQKIISKMESEIIRLPRSVMTVKTYIEDHYIPEFVNKRKPGTRRDYLRILKAHMLRALGATGTSNNDLPTLDAQKQIKEFRRVPPSDRI